MGASVLGNGEYCPNCRAVARTPRLTFCSAYRYHNRSSPAAPLPCGERVLRRLRLPASLLTIAFAGQGLFYAEFSGLASDKMSAF